MSCSFTVQGSNVDELGPTIDEGFSAALISSGLMLQDVHGTLESVWVEVDEVERTRSGGGVVHLRSGDVKYNLLCKSLNDIKSDVPSITPFNLIPYLSDSRE